MVSWRLRSRPELQNAILTRQRASSFDDVDCITVKSTLELSGSQEKKPKLDGELLATIQFCPYTGLAPLVAFKGRKLVFKQESLPKSALSRRGQSPCESAATTDF